VIDVVLTLLLTAHLLCVNVASGGPVVGAWLDWQGWRGHEAAARAARSLARWSLAGFLAGAALGLVIGWLKWDPQYRALWLGPLSYKLLWAGLEAIFSLVLLVGWWLCLPGRAGGSGAAMAARGVAAILAATNLLYHFPVLFSIAARLHDTGQIAGERIGGAAFRQQMIIGETPALATHAVLASLAAAGVMLLTLSLRYRRAGDEGGAGSIAVWGARWALAPSIAQLPVGLWTLAALPPAAQTQIMGGESAGTLLFVGALCATLWLVRDLAKIALGETQRPLLVRAITAMVLTVLLMTATQQRTRTAPQPNPSAGHALRGVP
jgi:hypothetical protein